MKGERRRELRGEKEIKMKGIEVTVKGERRRAKSEVMSGD